MPSPVRILRAALLGAALLALPACQYQPLYGPNSYASQSAETLSLIGVSDVETRVAQQVRNHLIFLLQGGAAAPQPTYDLKLRVVDNGRLQAAAADVGDTTAGVVTVTASYDLYDLATRTRIANGTRVASASYDRTGQSFANSRAVRDAENRAAREVAEQIRLALAADISRL